MTGASDLTRTLVGFARTLRAAGVPASVDRLHQTVTAASHLDVARRRDLYWAGRLTLCAGPDDLERYDRAFAAYFAGEQAPPVRRVPPVQVVRPVAVPGPERDPRNDDRDDPDDPDRPPAATSSELEVLRHRDLAALTTAERDVVRRLIAAIDPVGETRLSRRHRPSSSGVVDPRRTVRAMLRRGGEPVRLERRVRRVRPRRLVLIVDVSGSMQPYADAFLRFAHAAARRRAGTEVFTVGTRLTRVTREMRGRDPSTALLAVSGAVPDWSGGTRLGELMKAFLDRWGQRGVARGAVVVVASDGWERGDAGLLGEQMQRLSRLAHRVVWVNPHRGQPGYAPMTAGMLAALPSVDDFVDGHSLAALERLAAVVAGNRATSSITSRTTSGRTERRRA
ncbi:MAG: VWA domain-containing protein [Pseudonocardia sp.]|nr:VWA domain-containing protein [Pseudonocardia sp.]